MTPRDGHITEAISQQSFAVQSQLPVVAVDGLMGQALRFDGYSNYIQAPLSTAALSADALTFSVVLAVEAYPMMNAQEGEVNPTYATICGNLDETGKKGMAFELSSRGDVRFRFGSTYSGGFLFTANGTEKMPLGRWAQLTAVVSKADNMVTLYLDGRSIGNSRMSRVGMQHATTDFMIGKSAGELKMGPFHLNTFCGLIDDIIISNGATVPEATTTAATPNFRYPAERYAGNLWRPQFHAMPSGSWTNECHGMLYSGGRYHLFFQKNPNGPYQARLQWGHLSSADLCTWQEEPIALTPGENYDLKGCWSGCVYQDGGTPYILYTAVDNGHAVIAQAVAQDDQLRQWTKQGVVIDGRPQGLSDDFRDPYFFTANGKKYIIVGASKNGIGGCTLHRYENGQWTNDGTMFFQGTQAGQHGTFWEMPNVTPLGGGKWLFTCTPMGTSLGVRTLCWVGTIGQDGRFTPDASGMQTLEMGGISRDGYGLLSPTIYAHPSPYGGDTPERILLLGIVPDKLSTDDNFRMGWAHNFSLLRELSIAADGTLQQKPYEALASLRTSTAFSQPKLSLMGVTSLSPVSGRQIELQGEFTVVNGQMGFNFMKQGGHRAALSYDGNSGNLTLNLTTLTRTSNDAGVYNGSYSAPLPRKLSVGEKLKLHVFVDGSVADIFVNDQWAFSVRLFPTADNEIEAEAFATTQTQANVHAWVLSAGEAGAAGISEMTYSQPSSPAVYDLQGRRFNGQPQRGMYIKNGRKYISK